MLILLITKGIAFCIFLILGISGQRLLRPGKSNSWMSFDFRKKTNPRIAIPAEAYIWCFSPNMQGNKGIGRWVALNVQKCANDAEMPWTFHVRRYKVNRTHDGYDVDFQFLEDFDESVSARSHTCKMMDGGCKYFMTLRSTSGPFFVKTFFGDNLKRALEAAGIDPPGFPIPQGEYHLKNFVIDTQTLSNKGIYGEFGSETYLMKDGRDLLCIKMFMSFEPLDDWPATL